MKLRDPFTGETVDVEPHAKIDTRSRMTLEECAAVLGGERRVVRVVRFVLHEGEGPQPIEVTLTCEPAECDAVMARMTAALQALDWHGRVEIRSREVPA